MGGRTLSYQRSAHDKSAWKQRLRRTIMAVLHGSPVYTRISLACKFTLASGSLRLTKESIKIVQSLRDLKDVIKSIDNTTENVK